MMPDAGQGGRVLRRFSPDEDRRIEQLRMEGLTLREIAAIVGRRKSAVQMRLHSLARRAEEAEQDG